jgi:release factor glutamine methyltransferase
VGSTRELRQHAHSPTISQVTSRLDATAARLRAAGCVFAEEEAALLLAAAGFTAEDSPQPSVAARTPGAHPRPSPDAALEALVSRRVAGEPLEHVLGWAQFAGRHWIVAPGVFVPRQRSELLVECALGAVRPTTSAVVVDLCCGSGALGGSVAAALFGDGADVELHAADLDRAAVSCAETNLAPLGGEVHAGDLYAALPVSLRGRVDLLLCHAPYVPTAALAFLPPEAREHEPLMALDGGPDGLEVLRRVIWEATAWLAPGGTLLFELGDDRQLATARVLLSREGMSATTVEVPETGARVVLATRAGTSA